jgi:hypothetical protein
MIWLMTFFTRIMFPRMMTPWTCNVDCNGHEWDSTGSHAAQHSITESQFTIKYYSIINIITIMTKATKDPSSKIKDAPKTQHIHTRCPASDTVFASAGWVWISLSLSLSVSWEIHNFQTYCFMPRVMISQLSLSLSLGLTLSLSLSLSRSLRKQVI